MNISAIIPTFYSNPLTTLRADFRPGPWHLNNELKDAYNNANIAKEISLIVLLENL